MSCTSEEIEMYDEVVTRSVVIPAGPEDVWDALVDPSRLEDWFADEVEAEEEELVPDAEVVFRWDDGSERVGVVDAVDAPRRLAFRWAERDGGETAVSFELAEVPEGTRVTVVESGLASRPLAQRALGVGAGGPGAGASGGWAGRMSGLGLAACAVVA